MTILSGQGLSSSHALMSRAWANAHASVGQCARGEDPAGDASHFTWAGWS